MCRNDDLYEERVVIVVGDSCEPNSLTSCSCEHRRGEVVGLPEWGLQE